LLELKSVYKEYPGIGDTVKALRGVDISFRKSEFVSVLGPSGCGKTTLLNIIGGLDQYTSGDIIIDGRSTKEYKDGDWDAYRNHSVGFVFQTYNLISHQTVLSNVELALTLSGVSAAERRERAIRALEQVGLGDQIRKKPNQLSGGQMQRVAIARALVNDPAILLADEPTGALDTDTSVQVLDILKEVAKDRLVIMVTHNPDLADRYSTRIVRLLDGQVIGDTNPYTVTEVPPQNIEKSARREKNRSMSFRTAFQLSLNNLMTKKRRTLLTAFAGSIGIIGIALILSLSTGFQAYINSVESETLSNYPITIEAETVDFSSILGTMMGIDKGDEPEHGLDRIYSSDMLGDTFNTMTNDVQKNDLAAFKRYLESGETGLETSLSDVEYIYDVELQIFSTDLSRGVAQVNPSRILDKITGTPGASQMQSDMISFGSSRFSEQSYFDAFKQLQNSRALLDAQYELVEGSWPKEFDDVVLIVDRENEITDLTLYTLNILDQNEIAGLIKRMKNGETMESKQLSFEFSDFIGLEFSLVLPADYFEYDEDSGTWKDMRQDEEYMADLISDAMKLRVVGIIRPAEGTVTSGSDGGIGYMPSLTKYYIDRINETEIVKKQLEDPETDVFTGLPFSTGEQSPEITIEDVFEYIESLPEEEQAQIRPYLGQVPEETILARFKEQMTPRHTDATYADNVTLLGIADTESPSVINLYPTDFEAKDEIVAAIKAYNDKMIQSGEDDKVISYTDYVGMLMKNVTKIVNTISYVLIAFVAISLVVSSIMIGVITNISVLERTKEIGILRSIGASKRDISHVFNAETFIVGLAAGLIGVGLTILLCIPINAIIKSLANIPNVAKLEILPAAILVAISVVLTLFAGLIPSRSAARKDPVEALRTE